MNLKYRRWVLRTSNTELDRPKGPMNLLYRLTRLVDDKKGSLSPFTIRREAERHEIKKKQHHRLH